MKKVLAHGVFDVLHSGHLAYFQAAKRYGDWLVVSVTADRFVNKGPGRPYFTAGQRAAMVSALGIVNEVVISDHPTAVEVIEQIRPDYYVKGPDYADPANDVTGGIKAEIEAVKAVGGKFVCTNDDTYSSSTLLNRFIAPWSSEQQRVIAEVNSLGGMALIHRTLEQVAKDVNAVVLGENIEDVYKFVRPQALSSKSPSISAELLREEHYQGGANAIWNHIHDFCNVEQICSGTTHTKTRYMTEAGQRLFEVTEHPEEFRNIADVIIPPHNLIIAADFGHGYFKPGLDSSSWLALNVQTNSSNFGFNVFTKHESFDYLVIDKRELQLAYNDCKTDVLELGMKTHIRYGSPVAVTLGPQGSALFHEEQIYLCPAFADKVVDTIGAGDAFLALTSLLVKIETNPTLVGFLGNVFAGLKTRILGNSAPVSKVSLLKACESILK